MQDLPYRLAIPTLLGPPLPALMDDVFTICAQRLGEGDRCDDEGPWKLLDATRTALAA